MPRIARPLAIAVAAIAGAAALALTTAAHRPPSVVRVDFGATPRSTEPVYDARVAPAAVAPIKEFRIPMTHTTVEIAPGVRYQGWTFGGTVPGPVLRVRQGDLVRITLVNDAPGMPHSIDFHAARLPMDRAMRTLLPHDSLQFEFEATTPGAFMVHCGTPPVLLHIAQGMYFPIIVDPKGGWPTHADEEYVVVQSELYPAAAGADSAAPREGDFKAMQAKEATYVVFNGKAFQYKTRPLTAKPGDRVRLFVVNAGPSLPSAFHIVGTIFDKVYVDGNPAHALEGLQTQVVPPGDGIVVETTLREAGTYAFVTHAFADAEKGAVGLIKVAPPATVAAGH